MNPVKYKSNRELSVARAHTVLKYFLNCGIMPERLAIAGYGDTKPVGDNFTEEGRKKNRRVDIVLVSY